MQKHTEGKRKKQHHHQNVDPLAALCKTQSTAPKRQLTKTGPAVLAPLGAFGSAGPVRGGKRRVRSEFAFLQTPKASSAPRPARRPARYLLILQPLAPQMCDFCFTSCRSKIHRKSDVSKSIPKSQNLTPERPNCDFKIVFGTLLASFLNDFSYFFKKA